MFRRISCEATRVGIAFTQPKSSLCEPNRASLSVWASGFSVYQQQVRLYVALALVRKFATQAMIAVARIQRPIARQRGDDRL